ncbi:MAG: alpha/beta hydrolase [Caldilineaceae bacterium]
MKKILASALLIACIVTILPGAAWADGAIDVTQVAFPVTLSDQQSYTLVGYLYSRQGNPNDESQCGKRSKTVQVLLAGATYNHSYWDAPVINGVDYSYARYMAGQCYSVLALDRLGTGASSRPSGDFITKVTEADAIAQVLTALRTNHNPAGRRFKRIVLVGHSFGSFQSVYTLGEYGNVADALVVTGWIHVPGTVPLTPEYVQQLLQNPDITVAPEVRSQLFYYPPAADQAVIDDDNANLSDTLPRGFFLDGIGVFTARALGDVAQIKALTKVDQVDVPVFVQLGDQDVLFPSAIAGAEASFYSSAPSVTVDNLTNIGHGFNLHTNHLEGWQHIESWITNTVVNN